MKNARKKSIAVLAGLSVAGLVGASAASLGDIRSGDLGASTGVIGSCDTDGVDVYFGTGYAASQGIAVVNSVTISDVAPACDGQVAEVTLIDDADAPLGSATQTLNLGGGDSFTVSFSPRPSAGAATDIAIAISTPAP